MNVKLVRLYSEGNWGYYRVLVENEQAGYVAINDKTCKVGRTMHHPDCYPNDRVMDEIVRIRAEKKGVEYTRAGAK